MRMYTIQSGADGACSTPRGRRVMFALLEDYHHGNHCIPVGLHAGRCVLRGEYASNKHACILKAGGKSVA